MSTHELAKLLLEGPNIRVFAYDGMDPSDLCEVCSVEIMEGTEVFGELKHPTEKVTAIKSRYRP